MNTRQLNRADRLAGWSAADVLTPPIPAAAAATLPRLARVDDETAPLEYRARCYLDANCAQCHRPGGVRAAFDARILVPLDRQNLIDGPVVSADLGIPNPRVIAPGDRARSMLLQRLSRRHDPFAMPPIGSNTADPAAIDVIGRWVDSLPPR